MLLTAVTCTAATKSCAIPAEDDDRSTTVKPDTQLDGYGVPEGNFTSFYRVGRILGLGTSDRYNPDGTINLPQAYIQNGVMSPDGCVSFTLNMSLASQYYYWVQTQYSYYGTVLPLAFSSGLTVIPLIFQDGLIYQGGTPLTLPLKVRVSFNGQDIWQATINLPIRQAGYSEFRRVRVPVSAGQFHFARHTPARGGGSCALSPRPGEQNCPGLNKVVLRYSTPDSFERLFIGLDAPGVLIFGRGADISFSGMAPIFLATGCCGEQTRTFWDNTNSLPYTLSRAFRESSLPFYIPATGPPVQPDDAAIGGTIATGGQELAKRLTLYSQIFGTKWLHILAHSKGGAQ